MPSRTLPTRFFTGAWRCEVPSRDVPVAASASSASVRTLEGPAPNRPSAGLMSAGIWISATSRGVSLRRNRTETCPFDETGSPARGLVGMHQLLADLRGQADRQGEQVVLGHHRLV